MQRLHRLLALSAALAACTAGTPPDDLGYDGTGLAVTIAPLDLPSVSDACYSFEILNGSEQRVVARGSATGGPAAGLNGDGGPAGLPTPLDAPLCSSRFGDGQGALSYVAPCDASEGNQSHDITLWVNAVCQAGTGIGCTPLEGFVNPCGPDGCTVTATCQENADTPVQFNFTVMASAQQGFFDVAVNFDNVFCSAKVDTCHGQDPVLLLHDSQGTRRHTAVAAVACTAGPGDTTTHLHMTDLVIDCGGTQHTLDFDAITAEGNRPIGGLQGAVYFGTEDLPTAGGPAGSANKVFTHVAFILPDAPTSCDLSWTVAPTDDEDPPLTGTGSTFANVAAVSFDVTGLTAGTCTNHPLNAPGSGVTTTYLEEDPDYGASLAIGMTEFSSMERPLVMVFDTTLGAGTAVTLWMGPKSGHTLTVDWGDGSPHTTLASHVQHTHTYATEGTYTVRVHGQIQQLGTWNHTPPNRNKLRRVDSWGTTAPISLDGAFSGASNLIFVPPALPPGVAGLRNAFRDCTNFDVDISAWDTSNVSSIASAFNGASSFNQDISGWDVGNVTGFNSTFSGATSFNQDLSPWCVAQISSTPSNFDLDATSWVLPRPNWGAPCTP